jgi:hypothetical protein
MHAIADVSMHAIADVVMHTIADEITSGQQQRHTVLHEMIGCDKSLHRQSHSHT